MSAQETKKVLTAVDRSTKALTAATDTLNKGIQELGTQCTILSQQQSALALDIEFKVSELNELDQNLVAKTREHAAELRLKVKEDEDLVLTSLLKARKLAAFDVTFVPSLQKELDQATAGVEEAIAVAVRQALADASRTKDAEINAIKAGYEVASAKTDAELSSAFARIEFLNVQNAKLEETIVLERDARVKIAQADAAKQAVTVNTGK